MRKTTLNRQMIAQERSYNRKYNVKNNCIPAFVKNNYRTENDDGIVKYKWEKVESPQPKNLTKGKCFVKKDGKKVRVLSEQGKLHKKYTIKKYDKHSKEYIEAYIAHKLAKWEKKNPCPVKLDGIQQDLFENEFLLPWKEKKNLELKRISEFVISVYGKFPLVGRFKQSDDKYKEKMLEHLKDIDGSTAKYGGINHCPSTVPIIKAAKVVTDTTKACKGNLVSSTLKDAYNNQGRIILPGMQLAA